MSSPFPVRLPLERAFTRRMLFAAEIIDAVTLEPVTKDLQVKATGLTTTRSSITTDVSFGSKRPIVSHKT